MNANKSKPDSPSTTTIIDVFIFKLEELYTYHNSQTYLRSRLALAILALHIMSKASTCPFTYCWLYPSTMFLNRFNFSAVGEAYSVASLFIYLTLVS